MIPDFHRRKRTRFNLEANTMNTEYTPDLTKPVPADHTQFLADPYKYRVTEEFLNSVVLEENESLLTHCIKVENEAAVDVLLRCNVDPNQYNRRGVSPISAAAQKGYVPIVKLLIKAGAFVDAVNQSGSTALIQAAHFGRYEALKLLLEENANPHFANSKGTTALMRASQEGHVAITRALIDAGVDVNCRNHEGMNALMLASQRGHADIVMILIEAGASKDEQTAQGSTALMLACKRGHDKCVEVLVAMGAEIYMRDRRYRTARDTALRRSHTGLLVWLDTQVQVMKIQERHLLIRNNVIHDIRNAYVQGKIQLCPTERFVADLVTAVKDTMALSSHDSISASASTSPLTPIKQQRLEKQQLLIQQFLSSAPHLPVHAKSPETALATIRSVLTGEYAKAAEKVPVYRTASRPAKRCTDYADFLWPMLFERVLNLPSGVFESVIEFLPMPRVWSWSLSHMHLRCRLAPHQAVIDLSMLMDEVLRDMNVIGDPVQKDLLVKLARSPHLHDLLIEHYGITPAFLDKLCAWADVQSLVSRLSKNETEVEYKFPLARQMVHSAIYVYRWFRMRNSATSSLGLIPNKASLLSTDRESLSGMVYDGASDSLDGKRKKRVTFDSAQNPHYAVFPSAASASSFTDVVAGSSTTTFPVGIIDQDEVNLLEATDPVGHHGGDIDSDVVLMVEPDTESEFHVGGEGEDGGDDSDNDNVPLAMPPAPPAVAAPVPPPAAMNIHNGTLLHHLQHLQHQQQQQQQQHAPVQLRPAQPFAQADRQQMLMQQQQFTLQQHQQHLHQLHLQQQQQLQMQLQQQQLQQHHHRHLQQPQRQHRNHHIQNNNNNNNNNTNDNRTQH